MKLYKRLSTMFLGLLMITMLFPAFAIESVDLNRNVSLTINYLEAGTPLVGAEFDIYLVATLNERAELTPAESFRLYNVEFGGKNDEAWKTLASTLAGYILRDKIPPAGSGKTDTKGQVSFPDNGSKLTPGLYLVLGQRHHQDGYRYDALPFIVMLPAQDSNAEEWIYDITANSKHSCVIIPTDPDMPENITRKVLKVWKDKGHEEKRPKEIAIQLLRNGSVFDIVFLNAESNWRYTWDNLDGKYTWTVVEKQPEYYTVETALEGVTFVVTNTYTEDFYEKPTSPETSTLPTIVESYELPASTGSSAQPTKPDESTQGKITLPQTGQLWWPVPLLICAGLLFLVIGLIRRRDIVEKD
ncbi:MAG: Cna B-type domain-containing protein [Eubacteriales bacterium]|jgi:hypothetical protein